MLDIEPQLTVAVIPLFPKSILLQFEIGTDLPYPIAFDVYRSGEGISLEKLNTSPITQYFFEDIGLKPISKLFDVTYYIDINFLHTPEKQRVGPVHLVPKPRLARTFFVARRMDEKNGIEYSSHTGVELELYKRRHWGEKCDSCYNEILESATTTDCEDCLGTSFKGGYWSPVPILGKLEPLVKSRSLMDRLSYQENINTQAYLRAFPLANRDDIIKETRRNSLWHVHTVQLIEHGRFPVKQIVELREIERKDPLYRLLNE